MEYIEDVAEKVNEAIKKEFMFKKDNEQTRCELFSRVEFLLRKELINYGYHRTTINSTVKRIMTNGIWLNGKLYRPTL